MGASQVVNRWPCVGDPETWHAEGGWGSCPSEGVLSLCALVPGYTIKTSGTSAPVWLVLSSCKFHARQVRAFLTARAVEGVDTWGTEFLSENWDYVEAEMSGAGAEVLRSVIA
jgi:hypothetical protein